MKWFILLAGVVVLCFVVALVLGLVGGGMGGPGSSLAHEPLPEDELTDTDLDELSFDVTARGYRMSQVDGVIDRLRRELREKDEQIAVLRGEPPGAHERDEPDELDERRERHERDQPASDPASQPPSQPAAGSGIPAEPAT